MERIQAAIAKARATRALAHPDVLPRRSRQQDWVDSREYAWDALPLRQLDPQHMEDNRILGNTKSAENAAFDVLRTRTFKLMQANGWKRLAVTSPSASCGKSTVVINLGISLTRRADLSAMILETDMRRPSLSRKLGLPSQASVANVLRGTAPFHENAFRIGDRLAVATNAQTEANPAELLQSPKAGVVLRDLEDTYAPSVMLFDMPPLLVNDDTIAFLPNVDCALLVAAAEHTTIKEIDTCEQELAAHTNVLGVVLNKCRFSGRKYGYDYYE